MLSNLLIKNYVLIKSLEINFKDGLTIITGETGVGKSILLGGLSLTLGKRADLKTLKNKDTKCVVEAIFIVSKNIHNTFFKKNELEFDTHTIIRREILPSGKSRSFINDTPVNLSQLVEFGKLVIDIHSQFQTQNILNTNFQFNLIDTISKNFNYLEQYQTILKKHKEKEIELTNLILEKNNTQSTLDYDTFILNELNEVNLKPGIQEDLEKSVEVLSNVEDTEQLLSEIYQKLENPPLGVIQSLREIINSFGKLSQIFDSLKSRTSSILYELQDIFEEIKQQLDTLEKDPDLLEEASEKLQLIYRLQKKHKVNSIDNLINIKEALQNKLYLTKNSDIKIKELKAQLTEYEIKLDELSNIIHQNRLKYIPKIQSYLETTLLDLGMENTKFKILLEKTSEYKSTGKHNLTFLISTNKGRKFNSISNVLSGGERSRIMLSIKSLSSNYLSLPTIIFDEIDSGISGKISDKTSKIMLKMAKKMQIITITHSPQIASCGNQQYKVFKSNEYGNTYTQIKKLNLEERIREIAEMLSGNEVTPSAILHAKELLKIT